MYKHALWENSSILLSSNAIIVTTIVLNAAIFKNAINVFFQNICLYNLNVLIYATLLSTQTLIINASLVIPVVKIVQDPAISNAFLANLELF